jgi:hypothetical protein
MTLTDSEAGELAGDLHQARLTGVAIPPLTARYPGLTMADGYRVQTELVRRLTAEGERIVGYKLGRRRAREPAAGRGVAGQHPRAARRLAAGRSVRHDRGPARGGRYLAGQTYRAQFDRLGPVGLRVC